MGYSWLSPLDYLICCLHWLIQSLLPAIMSSISSAGIKQLWLFQRDLVIGNQVVLVVSQGKIQDDSKRRLWSMSRVSNPTVDTWRKAWSTIWTSSILTQVIQKFDHLFKVILLGDSGTGKSSLLCRFRDGDVSDKIVEVTGGIVFDHIIFSVGSEFVKMQVSFVDHFYQSVVVCHLSAHSIHI